jgi:hypothetical protein
MRARFATHAIKLTTSRTSETADAVLNRRRSIGPHLTGEPGSACADEAELIISGVSVITWNLTGYFSAGSR